MADPKRELSQQQSMRRPVSVFASLREQHGLRPRGWREWLAASVIAASVVLALLDMVR